eukprot:5706653-Prymnesium_polylepis.2
MQTRVSWGLVVHRPPWSMNERRTRVGMPVPCSCPVDPWRLVRSGVGPEVTAVTAAAAAAAAAAVH